MVPKAIDPPVPPVRVNVCAPLVTPDRVISAPAGTAPPFVVSKVTAASKFMGPAMFIAPPLVVILPLRLTAAAPVKLTAPVVVIVAVGEMVLPVAVREDRA